MLDADRRGHFQPGGVLGYPLDRIHEEVAYLAYHFNWPPETIMAMEHGDRRRWVAEVADINLRKSELASEE